MPYVYPMSNAHNSLLYIGVTSDLMRRVAQHKAKANKGFTERYNADKLVYFEVADAIAREKQLKNWQRAWKNDLVATKNPS